MKWKIAHLSWENRWCEMDWQQNRVLLNISTCCIGKKIKIPPLVQIPCRQRPLLRLLKEREGERCKMIHFMRIADVVSEKKKNECSYMREEMSFCGTSHLKGVSRVIYAKYLSTAIWQMAAFYGFSFLMHFQKYFCKKIF